MGVDAELTGMDELLDRVQELGRKGSTVQNKALKAAAEPVANDMKSLVRVSNVNEKHIRDDIKVSNVRSKDGTKYVRIGPGKDTNWRAKFLEFGTSKMPAYPFMSPSYENKKGEAKQIMKETIKEGLGL